MKLSISVRDEESCDGVVERPVDDNWLTAGNLCCAASLVNNGWLRGWPFNSVIP